MVLLNIVTLIVSGVSETSLNCIACCGAGTARLPLLELGSVSRSRAASKVPIVCLNADVASPTEYLQQNKKLIIKSTAQGMKRCKNPSYPMSKRKARAPSSTFETSPRENTPRGISPAAAATPRPQRGCCALGRISLTASISERG